MALIVKCRPAGLNKDGICVVFAPAFGEVRPDVGEAAYLWFSETSGGQGLTYRGIVEAVGDGTPLPLAVRIDGARLVRPLRKQDLAAHRENQGQEPLATLARKVYRHAHDKVADLDQDEVAFLDGHFEAPPASPTKGWRRSNVFLPNGTELRMSYNGNVASGRVDSGAFYVGGNHYDSPSGAARAVAVTRAGKKTNLNGWVLWEARLPGSVEWVLLEDLHRRTRTGPQDGADLLRILGLSDDE